MQHLSENEANELKAEQLRFKEAEFMLDSYVASTGKTYDSYFHMISFFDAFLFLFVSVEELAPEKVADCFRKQPIFAFLKGLRNLTAHHAIAAGSVKDNKFVRPVGRAIMAGGGGGKLFFFYPRIEAAFDEMARERRWTAPGLDVAKKFAADHFPDGSQVLVEDVFAQALERVRECVFPNKPRDALMSAKEDNNPHEP